MGGPGSGSWYRWSKKDTAEDYRQLDVWALYRGGWLHPGMTGRSTWSRNGREVLTKQ